MASLRRILCVLVLALFTSAQIQSVDEEGNPPSLGAKEFTDLTGTYFVKFFSPYCPHCKALEPKWNAAFKKVSASGADSFKWASVNCVEQGDLCNAESITVYPTMRIYQNGKRVYDYDNPGASQADLQSFALAYASKREAAFAKEFETAPNTESMNEEAAEEFKETEKQKIKQESLKDEAIREKLSASEDQMIKDKEVLEKEAKDLAKAATIKEEAAADSDVSAADDEASSLLKSEGNAENIDEDENAAGSVVGKSKGNKNTPADDAENPASNEAKTANVDGEENSGDVDQDSENSVSILSANDFGPSKNVGRWFVLFTSTNCQGCKSMIQKWGNHERFAKDIQGINWGRVDCDVNAELCDIEKVFTFPTLRIYQDGMPLFNYKGSTDSMMLRKFLKHASTRVDFDGFSLGDLDNDGETAIQPHDGKNQEPEYLTGPVVQKPEYGSDLKIMDVVKYTLDTLGQPIDEDPGKLIFGESPEYHHNFRTWGAPDAPPPPFINPNLAAPNAFGDVVELDTTNFNDMVKSGSEPWLIKFYSPKCSFCVSMASEYEALASSMEGKLNVGAVNCEAYSKLCNQEGVEHWPYIVLYKAGTRSQEHKGARTVQAMSEFALQAYAAQIIPIESEEQLGSEIIDNMDKNLTTYIYLYDQSVMDEDWESLSEVAVKINAWGGKLYRSNSDKLRELAGITHRGTAFVNVDFIGEAGEGSLKWYDYPWSNMPKRIRDSDEVSKWAERAKYSLLQYLDPVAQTQYSPYVAVILTEGTQPPSKDSNVLSHKKKALELREFYRERQIRDQDTVRIDKLNQHDNALLSNDFVYARNIMKEPINMPLFTDLSFAYIPLDTWVAGFNKYMDVSKHTVGSVIIVDFYNGVYIDEFNHMPIKTDRDVLDDLVEFLHRYENRDTKTVFTSLRHFKKSYKGIPEPLHRSTHFHMKGESNFVVSFLKTVAKVCSFIMISYLVFKFFVRPVLRASAGKKNGNSSKIE